MAYTVRFSSHAARQLRKLPRDVQERVRPVIDALADDPRPPRARRLAGREDGWRIRVGAYRVLYAIHDDVLTVLVVEVGHRREVYE
jgi:mRNA interferase RelE/StbE